MESVNRNGKKASDALIDTVGRGDPLKMLSFECASIIFDCLTVADIGACQCVCRGWRDYLDGWIVSHGLRFHYPHDAGSPDTKDPATAIQIFKDNAAVESNFRFGKPSSIQQYEKAKYVATGGGYAAWFTPTRGIFTQRLGYKDNGSVHRLSTFPLGDLSLESRDIRYLTINERGYLHFYHRKPYYRHPMPNLSRNIVKCIATNKEIWSIEQQVVDNEEQDIALATGRDRAYFFVFKDASPPVLVAYDFSTGRLPYELSLPICRDGWLSWYHGKNYYPASRAITLPSERGELLIILAPSRGPEALSAAISVVNGDTGQLIQVIDGLRLPAWGQSYLMSGPDRRSFALLMRYRVDRSLTRFGLVKVLKFVLVDDRFMKASTEIVCHNDDPGRTDRVGIDPFRSVMITVPRIGFVVSRMAEGEPITVPEGYEGQEPLDEEIDRFLYSVDERGVTLPPLSKRSKNRRSMGMANDSFCDSVWMLDGGRVVAETDPGWASTCRIVDFGRRNWTIGWQSEGSRK